MATLPSTEWLVQQQENEVVVFHRYTEEEIVRFIASDGNACAQAQGVIHFSDQLSDEDKTFAHFWSGYFYGCAQ